MYKLLPTLVCGRWKSIRAWILETVNCLGGLAWPDRLGRRSAYQCLQMVVKLSRRHLGAGAWPLLIAVRFSGV